MLDPRKPTKGNPVRASSAPSDLHEPLGIVDVLQEYIDQLFPRKRYNLFSNDAITTIVNPSLQYTLQADEKNAGASTGSQLAS